jgi:hypothetical protein
MGPQLSLGGPNTMTGIGTGGKHIEIQTPVEGPPQPRMVLAGGAKQGKHGMYHLGPHLR